MNPVPSVVRPKGQPDLVVQAAKVFGNTVRLSIINALKQGPALRADLVSRTGLTAKTLGSQLTELEVAGAVRAEVQQGRGRPMLYYANHTQLAELLTALAEYALGDVPGMAEKTQDEPR